MFSLLQPWSSASPGQAHLWITYGWLAVCSVAPIVVVLIIWATCMHYTYRQKWRTLDVLLGAALLQELPNALLVLIIGAVKSALIHLPRNLQAHSVFCYFLVWSSTTSRFFQFAILTSLIVDRALILKWPYRYRFAVRHSQIRVYLVIMAFLAMLVGGCAIVSHFYRVESDTMSIGKSNPLLDEYHRLSLMNQSTPSTAAINQTSPTAVASVAMPTTASWPLSQQHNVYRFTYNLSSFEVYFNCFFVSVYALFSLLSVVCFFFVECNRPRSGLSSSSTSSSSATSKNRYLPSIATLFTTATNTSTTSSSTSSSLSTSSPLPARFSSMANMANAAVLPGGANQHGHANAHHHHHHQQQHLQKHPSQQANNFYSSNGKREQGHTPTGAAAPSPSSRTQSETLNSLYPISIVDIMGNETGQVMSSGYPSMIATDSSIYRMIETNNGSGSRSNSLSLIQGNHGESKQSEMMASTPTNTSFQMQHRSNLSASSGHFTQSDPATSLDPLNPTSCSSRVNSFSKAHHYSTASSQLKLNTTDSNDSSSFNPLANSAAHRSAFDFRWSSVLGPTTFCLAFNHGPYLIFSLLSLVMPEMWTPFHDLILVGLSLFEALLLPLIFFISDVTFREAVKKSCYCGGGRQRRHLSDKITSKSHHHPSLAFSDRNLITPPYLKSLANPLPSKQQLSRPSSLAIQNYQSDLDLSNKDHSTSKLNKLSFLKHHSDHLSSSKPVSNHATSMLDLSMSSRNAYHYGHGQGQGTRSRHSVAILPHLPNGSLTPRSSFRRRPPSVASYHYLYSSQQQQQQQQSPVSVTSNKYPQYLFGAAPAKSESASNLPTLSGNSTNNSNSSNYFSQLSAMKNFQLKKINEVDIGDRELAQLGTNPYNVPINGGSSQQLSHNSDQQQSKGDDKHLLNTKSGQKTIKELFNGLAARSSFKRRSVRKCGSDASTFYTRRNLKRSQIAHNQLSSILYNNFYIKKLGPPNFGSQLTLLSDNELIQHENGLNSSGKEAQHCVPALSPFSHLPSRQLSYDFGQHSPQITNPHVYLPNGANVLDSHNRSSSCNQLSVLNVDTGHYHNHLLLKQNMALQQQLSSSGHNTPRSHSGHPNNGNGDKISDYGHQQLNSDNSLLIAEEEHIYASLPEEEENEEEGDEDDEDDAKVSSGSFSARSTLPDNCQLISYSPIASAMNNQPYHQTTNAANSVFENAGVYASKDGNFQLFGCSRLLLNESKLINGNNGSSQSSGSNSPSHSANSNSSRSNSNSHSQLSSNGDSKQFNGNLSTSSSTSTVHDTTTEDIYEEVSNLIDTTPSRHSRFINSRKQSSSQDTLIGFDGGQDCAPNSSTEYDQQLDDDQVDEDVNNDDDDDDEIEDDQISMISEASSSTFSSFTTCANQDFEFIVSQYDNNVINNTAVDDDNSTRISNNNPIVNNHQRQQRNCDELYDNTPTKKKCSIIDNADQKHRQTPQQQVSNGNHNSNEVVLNVDDGEEDGNETRNKPTASVEQPSTVSMAAIYYSRYILNESCAEKKLAHRQRSKIDRRQSFSTAYELRQRILLGQLDRQQQQQQPNGNGKQTALDNNDQDSHNQMNLIEEEEVEENSTNFGVHINNVDNDNEDHDNGEDRQLDYSQFTANLEEMFPYKLSRRISTSEDNLLSIISTIANCGEDGGNGGNQQEEDEEQRKTTFIGTSSSSTAAAAAAAAAATAVNDNNSKPKPNKLLAKQSQDTKDNYQEQSKKNDNKNDNQNNNSNNNRKLSELKKNSTLVLSNRKDSNKLFVKNVNNTNNAQLQQANNNNNNNSSKQSPNSAIPRRISAVPVPAATKSFKAPQPPTSQNNISIKELKSKRNHHHQVSSKFQEIVRTTTTSTTTATNGNKLFKPNPERICELGSLWDRSASNPNSRHQSPLKPKTNLGANAKSNGSPVLTSSNNNNNNKGNSLTSSTSSSSSPSSPSSRVPTFIPASQIRSPQQISSGPNFQSKILPPSQYHHNNKQGPIQPKLKQNPRQNAILAKNALLLSSGIQQSSNLK